MGRGEAPDQDCRDSGRQDRPSDVERAGVQVRDPGCERHTLAPDLRSVHCFAIKDAYILRPQQLIFTIGPPWIFTSPPVRAVTETDAPSTVTGPLFPVISTVAPLIVIPFGAMIEMAP